jgi:hypothetical protein
VAEKASYEDISITFLEQRKSELTSPTRRHKETKSVIIILGVFENFFEF